MNSTEGRLAGRVAVVTGGSSGLGRATASALAAEGAAVAVLARASDDLERTADDIRRAGATALAVTTDLADAGQIRRALDRIAAELGGADILVNAGGTDVPGPVVDLDVTDWDRVLDVNLRAAFLLSQGLFPVMQGRGGGTIVNVGSVAGRRGWADAAAYCASKFGLAGLTQALAAEGRPHRIRVCLLYPGAMDTHWGHWSPADRQTPGRATEPAEALPPADVAGLITWICTAPPDVVLNEVTVTPLLERGWP
jgi:NAD(P)-dependent dehydrogenase (short-subunit alcohol dehydrogenase family)